MVAAAAFCVGSLRCFGLSLHVAHRYSGGQLKQFTQLDRDGLPTRTTATERLKLAFRLALAK